MSIKSFYTLIAWVWTLLVASTCLLPPSSLKQFHLDDLLQFDKLLHAIVFYVLYIAWNEHFKLNSKLNLSVRLLLFICCVLFGIAIEFVQQTNLIGRSFEWADVAADTFGCLLAVITVSRLPNLYTYYQKYLPFVK